MALQQKYKSYLANPQVDALTSDATLNYVTSTTSIADAPAIVKHLKAQDWLVEKKSETFLNVIEGSDSICVETETKLEFVHGAGTYLPGLDDNFVAGKTVVLPITHIVIFDQEQRIKQIRLLWDQGCLLKAVDTIGPRGRNWPIRDGKEQIKMITASAGAAPVEEPRAGRQLQRGKDPYSSLAIFEPPKPAEREESPRHSVAPRESAKPPPREWTELLSDNPEPERSPSPSKRSRDNSNPLKSGAGKHYAEPRLFDSEANGARQEPSIKTEPRKFDHFEFGEAEVKPSPLKDVKNKHASQWDFSDFVTPQKPPTRKFAGNNQPKFSWQTEEALRAAEHEPVFRQPVPQPRRDATKHFDLDQVGADSTTSKPASRPMSSRSMYSDNVLGAVAEEGEPKEQKDMPLRSITNPNQHNKTFETKWEMTDADPKSIASKENQDKKPSVDKNSRHWDLFESSPEPQQRGIKIAGDGMGKRKQNERHWYEFEE